MAHTPHISNSKSFAQQLEYPGYSISRQDIQSLRNNIEINAILSIKAPKTRNEKQLHQFIGIFNYYRDMWFCRCELLAKFYWLASYQEWSSLNVTSSHQQAFDKIKKVIGTEKNYFSDIQTSTFPFTFILMHQIIILG
jgi:hypothetical protein